MAFPIDVDTTYVLKKRDNGLAYIDAVAKMDMGDESEIEMGPAKVSLQMSGVLNTASVVDEVTGWALRSNTTMNFTGVVKMAANEQMPQGMTIPMTINGTVKVETIE